MLRSEGQIWSKISLLTQYLELVCGNFTKKNLLNFEVRRSKVKVTVT